MSPIPERNLRSRDRQTNWGHVLVLLSGAWLIVTLRGRRSRQRGQARAQSSGHAGVGSLHQTQYTSQDTPKADDYWKRVAAECGLLALVLSTVAVSVTGVSGVARLLFVLAAACLVPGGALLTRLSTDDLLSTFGLAVGLSLCIEAVGALVMIWTGWWHPLGFSLALVALACAVLILDLRQTLATRSGWGR